MQLFRATSRELNRLESISKSPLYALFDETLDGLETIRAYRLQDGMLGENVRKMLINLRVVMALAWTNRWLGVYSQFVGNAILFTSSLAVLFGTYEKAFVFSFHFATGTLMNCGPNCFLHGLLQQMVWIPGRQLWWSCAVDGWKPQRNPKLGCAVLHVHRSKQYVHVVLCIVSALCIIVLTLLNRSEQTGAHHHLL